MGQHHDHSHHHAEGNIKVAFFLNLTFTIIELIGGFYTNSLAILSDAIHDLGDSLSLGLAWYFQKLSQKGRTNKFSYGYGRFSLMGALINSVVLVVGSGFMLSKAIPGLFAPEDTNVQGMMLLAVMGIIFNGAAVFKLSKGESLNERAVYLHLLEDVFGWVAVMVGSIIMMFVDAPFIDPLLSLLISGFILYNVFKNLRQCVTVLLQGVPEEIDLLSVEERIRQVPKINDLYDLHIWSMDGHHGIMTVNLQVSEDYQLSELDTIREDVREALKEWHIDHFTIEFERVKSSG